MATTTTTIEVDIAVGRALSITTPGEARVDIVAGTFGAGDVSYPVNPAVGERVMGPYGSPVRVRIRPGAGSTVTYKDKLQQVAVRAEVDPVTGAPDGILTSLDGKQFTSLALIVSGGDQVGDVLSADFVNGTGNRQWYRQNPSTLAVTEISGQTGATYTRAVADVGFIVSCYATSWTQMAAGRVTRPGVPTAPQTVAAVAGDRQATITWAAPASTNGGALLNPAYIVTRLPGGQQFTTNALTFTDTGLTNNATYTYYIQAVNAAGPSPSAASNAVTPSAVTTINALSSVTLFGDSLMANGNPVVTGSGPGQGGETSVSHVGWANDTLRKAGVGIDAVQLRAVGGTTIKQHIANQLPAVLTDTSVGAWWHGGVNSYNDSITTPLGGPYSQATNIADAINLIRQLAAVKAFVIVDSINPVSQSGTTGAKTRAAEFPAHNAAVKAECDTWPNVIYLDTYSVMVDPASPQLNPLPNLTLGSDGIHWPTFGARVVGDYTAAQLSGKLVLTRYKTAGTNLLPDFTTTGGTTTPGGGTITGAAALANNWNCAITAGAASVTLSNPVAGTLRLTISNPGGAASSVVLSALNTAALLAAIASGDTIQGGFDFATVGPSTNLTRISCAFRTNGATGTLWNAMTRDLANEPSGDFKYNQSASFGRRWLHPRVVPAAPTAVDFLITIAVDPVGAAVVDISLPTLFKLT